MSAETLQRALTGGGAAGTKVMRGARPPALDGPSLRAATTPLMAAFLVAAAILRARMDTGVFDLIGIVLRTLAVAFTLRATLDVAGLLRHVLRSGRAPDHALAWDDDGLLLQTPTTRTYLRRADIAGFVAPPAKLPGEARRRARPIWVAVWPGAEASIGWLTIPPYFAADSDGLHARLSRWLGPSAPPENADADGGPPRAAPGGWVARRAAGFYRRAPWGWLLLGLACLDALRVAPAAWREALWMPAVSMAALTLLAPVAWAAWLAHRTRTPGGLLLSITPRHVTGIGRHGSVSLRWQDVSHVALTYRARWAPFEGAYATRSVEIRARDGSQLRFDASLLDAPVEVVATVASRLSGVEVEGP